jgi:primosomal replication protein N
MTEVDLFISTQRIKVLNADTQVPAGTRLRRVKPSGIAPQSLHLCHRVAAPDAGLHIRQKAWFAVPATEWGYNCLPKAQRKH